MSHSSAFARKGLSLKRKGEEAALNVVIEADAAGFSIRPETVMTAGTWSLVIDPRLENLAGNSIARPFNRGLDQGAIRDRGEVAEISFEVLPVQ